jgi:hypothetical protein
MPPRYIRRYVFQVLGCNFFRFRSGTSFGNDSMKLSAVVIKKLEHTEMFCCCQEWHKTIISYQKYIFYHIFEWTVCFVGSVCSVCSACSVPFIMTQVCVYGLMTLIYFLLMCQWIWSGQQNKGSWSAVKVAKQVPISVPLRILLLPSPLDVGIPQIKWPVKILLKTIQI